MVAQRAASVVIPVEQLDGRLERTLGSLLAQTEPVAEVLLIALGPSEELWRGLAATQQKHQFVGLVRQRRSGLVGAINAGIALCRGPHVTWLHPGCQLRADGVSAMMAALEERTETGFVFAASHDRPSELDTADASGQSWAEKLLAANPVACAFLCRKECIEAVGLLREQFPGAEEWDLWIRISDQFAVVALPEELSACGRECGRPEALPPDSPVGRSLRHHHLSRRNVLRQETTSPTAQHTGPGDPTARRRKLLMAAPELPPLGGYGVGRYVQGLAHILSAQECEVHLITPQETRSPFARHDGVHVHWPQKRPPFRAPTSLSDSLQEQALMLRLALDVSTAHGPFDILCLHSWERASLCHALHRALGLPIVATVHRFDDLEDGDRPESYRSYVREVQSWICECAERVLSLSTFAAEQAMRLYGVPPGKIAVLPLAVDDAELQTDADLGAFRGLFGAPDGKLVAFAGRLEAAKGIQVMVDSLPHVLTVCPDTRVVIAGEGPLGRQLADRVRELGLDSAVTFAGRLGGKVLTTLLRASSVYVIPSLVEASGLGALEAMLCGVPVVAAASGGLRELVRDGENGLLVPAGDPKALAAAVVRVLYDRELAQGLADRAREEVIAEHLWPDRAGAFLSAYTRIES